MKHRNFEVPVRSIVDFAVMLDDNRMNNCMMGATEDDEIIVRVYYEPDEREILLDLIEFLESGDDEEEEEY